jgi:ABC-type branched-subunit amino acid transport system ATPase component
MFFQLENLRFTFPGKNHLLDDVSAALLEKKIYALMGGNGSGKTTLFNIISGFIRPQSGRIIFKGQDITGLPSYRINRLGVGRTFQDLRLISKLSVRENILLAMQHNPTDSWVKALLPRSTFRQDLNRMSSKADGITTEYFLQGVASSFAGEISFGQQKLLNLACCVANGADLLLIDEPVAGISPVYREQITGLLKNLKHQGKTILMIEHNTDFVAETADHFLFLMDGRLQEYNTFDSLKLSKTVADAYFQ